MEEDCVLMSGSKAMSTIIYMSIFIITIIFMPIIIIPTTCLSKNRVTHFQNYSTKESFSLRTPIDKEHSLNNSLLYNLRMIPSLFYPSNTWFILVSPIRS